VNKKKSTVRYVTRKMKGDICNAKKSASDNFFYYCSFGNYFITQFRNVCKSRVGEEKETLEIELGEVKVNNVDNEVEIDVNIVNTEIETGEDVFQENKEFGLESNILENEKSIDCVIEKLDIRTR